mgnify:CR=1 FL=1
MINKKDLSNLQGLIFLYALAKTGNKTAVANELGVSVDTVNKYITDLETSTNTKLVFSNGRGTFINPEAKNILKIAAEIAQNLHLFNTYTQDNSQCKGTVRLCTNGFISNFVTSNAFREFTQMYPDIDIDLKMQSAANKIDLLEADVAFDTVIPQNKDVVLLASQNVKFGLFASPQYLEENGHPKNLEDLYLNHRFCVQNGQFKKVPEVVDLLSHVQRICFSTDSVAALRNALIGGWGIGICSLGSCGDNLVRLENVDFEFSLDIHLLAHQDTQDLPRIRVFIDYLKNIMARNYADLPIAVACSAE